MNCSNVTGSAKTFSWNKQEILKNNVEIRNLIYQAPPNLKRTFLKKSEGGGGAVTCLKLTH